MAKINMLSQLPPNFEILHAYAILPGQRRYRCIWVTCYDVPIFRLQSPGDSSQPITTLSPTIMRRVAIRYELRPTLCDWCETARSPSQSSCRQTSYGSIARSCLWFLSQQSDVDRNKCDWMRLCCKFAKQSSCKIYSLHKF